MKEVVVAIIKPSEINGEIVNEFIKGVKQEANVQKIKIEDKDVNSLIDGVIKK